MSMNLPRPQAALFDVDGTLLPYSHLGKVGLPSERVTQAVRETSKLIPTGLISARQPQKTINLIKHLELSGLTVLSNGAQIYDAKNEELVVERVLDHDIVRELGKKLTDENFNFWIQDDGIDYPFDTSYDPLKPFMIVVHHATANQFDQIFELTSNFDTMTAFVGHVFPDTTIDIFIADVKTNKAEGIRTVTELLGLEPKTILGIGDMPIDIVLMEECGIGVAMGNAVDEVKEKAVYVTGSVEEDGVATALEKFVLRRYRQPIPIWRGRLYYQ